MAAVIRLKRHLDDEPLDALVINYKRQKRNDDKDESEDTGIKTVLKFAGTINKQDEDLVPHISKISKTEIEQNFKKHIPDVGGKNRKLTNDSSKNNRFKVVNLSRAISTDADTSIENADGNKLALTVLDIESDITKDECGSNATEEYDSDYVYDLYYTNSDDIGENELDSIFSVYAADELVYGSYRDNGKSDHESDSDSEDSNDENNCRNEYPDADDDNSSVDEDDMRQAMGCMTFKAEDLSSDDGEEGFVYSIDSEAAGFEEDLDHSDVRRYGELYARFKANQKKEEEKYNRDIYNDELEETDEDYYD